MRLEILMPMKYSNLKKIISSSAYKDEDTMKIGIISDTHISKGIGSLHQSLIKSFDDVDIMIHAGDFIDQGLLNTLKKFKRFIGVFGNIDSEEIKSVLKEKEIVELQGYKIGIYHGHGEGKTTIDRAYEQFKDMEVDIIIFGHSHQPIIKTYKNVLMLNPGSPTSKRRERWFSYIILQLSEDSIQVNIKFFSNKQDF